MRKPVWIILATTVSVTLLFAALHAANPDYRSKDHPLGDFHRWTKVNDEPALLDPYVMELCRAPTEIESHQLEVNPHRTYVDVYVNAKGRDAMLSGVAFPVGTVIVKEKLGSLPHSAIESTAMVKREAGYNPTCGDWEFDTLDSVGSKVTSSGRNETCMSCHAMHSRHDHTFRFYLPVHRTYEGSYVWPGGWQIFPDMPYDY